MKGFPNSLRLATGLCSAMLLLVALPDLWSDERSSGRVVMIDALPDPVVAPARFDLQLRGDTLRLHWSGSGVLETTKSLGNGEWTGIALRSPHMVADLTAPSAFYRVRAATWPVRLYVPSSYDPATASPLVVLLHGLGGTGPDVEEYLRLSPLAEDFGFLLAYPDATHGRDEGEAWWDVWQPASESGVGERNDSGDLRALIETIENGFNVDPKRIHVMGFSLGGFMAYRLACDHSDKIAGIASLAGGTVTDASACDPPFLVHVLQIHGTADSVIQYGGGLADNVLEYPSARESTLLWGAHNGCEQWVEDSEVTLDLDLARPGLDTRVSRYLNNPPGGSVQFWTIVGAGHSPDYDEELIIRWLLDHTKIESAGAVGFVAAK